jgi:hypothetical protein
MTHLAADLAAERFAGVVRELQAALDEGPWTPLEQLRHRAELPAATVGERCQRVSPGHGSTAPKADTSKAAAKNAAARLTASTTPNGEPGRLNKAYSPRRVVVSVGQTAGTPMVKRSRSC